MGDERPAGASTDGLDAPVSVGWLILQRLGDLKEGQARLEVRFERLDAKVDSEVASLREGIVTLRDEMRDEIGTLRDEMRGEIGTVRGEIGTLRDEMRGEIGTVRGEIGTVRGEIGTVRGEIGALRTEFETKLARATNSQLLVGILGFLGVIATLVAVLVRT